MIRTSLILSFSVFTAIFMAGCNTQKDLAAAESAVTRFHAQLDNQDFQAIYKQADQSFREATKQDDFVALMTAIHKKLGHTENAARQGFFVNYNTSGTRIRLTYETKFAGGNAQEQFVWVKDGDGLVLVSYNINSNALILK